MATYSKFGNLLSPTLDRRGLLDHGMPVGSVAVDTQDGRSLLAPGEYQFNAWANGTKGLQPGQNQPNYTLTGYTNPLTNSPPPTPVTTGTGGNQIGGTTVDPTSTTANYATPSVYLPGLNGQTTSYQEALNRLAMGGSPLQALGGLLGGQNQQFSGYTGANAQHSGLLGATPINTSMPQGYGPPITGGPLPPVSGGGGLGHSGRPSREQKDIIGAQRDAAKFANSPQSLQVQRLSQQIAQQMTGTHQPFMERLNSGYLTAARQMMGLPVTNQTLAPIGQNVLSQLQAQGWQNKFGV